MLKSQSICSLSTFNFFPVSCVVCVRLLINNRLKNDNKPQEIPQKMILQKHIIPCLNKRHNRSSHPNQDGKRTVG